MSSQYESIKIGMIMDNQALDISNNFFSFTYTESIHNLIPTVNLIFQDYSGLLNETIFFCEGKEFTLTIQDLRYDDNEVDKKIHCVVAEGDAVFSNNNNSYLSTDNKVKAVHTFYNNDGIKSVGYKDNSSDIVKKLVNEYKHKFSKVNIQTSNDKKIYYQPLKSDIEFIDDILKKEAYNVNETPYFCYIDSFDEFNYVTYSNMMLQDKVGSLNDLPEDPLIAGRGLILNYSILNTGSFKLKKHRNKDIYLYSNTGEMLTKEIKLLDLSGSTIAPIVDNKTKTAYIYNNNESYDSTEENSIKGRYIQQSKDSFFIERIQVLTPYDYKLRVGRKVDVKFHISNVEEIIDSTYYNGEYLIELNTIVWDGDNQILNNNLILSRCKFTIDTTINIKPKLIQG